MLCVRVITARSEHGASILQLNSIQLKFQHKENDMNQEKDI